MSRAYLIDAIECGLDGIGAFDALTADQIRDLAASLEISLENEGLATGRDAIPNPMEAELRRREAAFKDELSRLERREAQSVEELERTVRQLRSRIYDLSEELRRTKP